MKISNLLAVVSGVMISGAAFAEGAEAAVSSGNGLIAIGSALAIGLAAIGASGGQGKAAGAALEGIARNPGSKDSVFVPMLISLAFIELPALLGFLVAVMWFTSVSK